MPPNVHVQGHCMVLTHSAGCPVVPFSHGSLTRSQPDRTWRLGLARGARGASGVMKGTRMSVDSGRRNPPSTTPRTQASCVDVPTQLSHTGQETDRRDERGGRWVPGHCHQSQALRVPYPGGSTARASSDPRHCEPSSRGLHKLWHTADSGTPHPQPLRVRHQGLPRQGGSRSSGKPRPRCCGPPRALPTLWDFSDLA